MTKGGAGTNANAALFIHSSSSLFSVLTKLIQKNVEIPKKFATMKKD